MLWLPKYKCNKIQNSFFSRKTGRYQLIKIALQINNVDRNFSFSMDIRV